MLVCLGNPPYDRQAIDLADAELLNARAAGFATATLARRRTPASRDTAAAGRLSWTRSGQAGAGVHLKNLYNDYVYFWRWALWKVFDNTGGAGDRLIHHGGLVPAWPGIWGHARGDAADL